MPDETTNTAQAAGNAAGGTGNPAAQVVAAGPDHRASAKATALGLAIDHHRGDTMPKTVIETAEQFFHWLLKDVF